MNIKCGKFRNCSDKRFRYLILVFSDDSQGRSEPTRAPGKKLPRAPLFMFLDAMIYAYIKRNKVRDNNQAKLISLAFFVANSAMTDSKLIFL